MGRGRIDVIGSGAYCVAARLYGKGTSRLPRLVSRHSRLRRINFVMCQQTLDADRTSNDTPLMCI